MKFTLVAVAFVVMGLVACNNSSDDNVAVECCDSTNVGHFDSICSDSVVVDNADLTITVTCDSVTITE